MRFKLILLVATYFFLLHFLWEDHQGPHFSPFPLLIKKRVIFLRRTFFNNSDWFQVGFETVSGASPPDGLGQ